MSFDQYGSMFQSDAAKTVAFLAGNIEDNVTWCDKEYWQGDSGNGGTTAYYWIQAVAKELGFDNTSGTGPAGTFSNLTVRLNAMGGAGGSGYLPRDGTLPMTGDLDLGDNGITSISYIGDTSQALDVQTHLQVTGVSFPTDGVGVEIYETAGTGVIIAYDRTVVDDYIPLIIGGSTMSIRTGGTQAIGIDASQNVDITNGTLSVGGSAVPTGSGTLNYIPKWASASSLGDSGASVTAGNAIENTGGFRSKGWSATGATGAGAEVLYASGIGYFISYDRTLGQYDNAVIGATDIIFKAGTGGTNTMYFSTGLLRPYTDGGMTLGNATYRFSNLYVDSIGDSGQGITVPTRLQITGETSTGLTGAGIELYESGGTVAGILGYNRTTLSAIPLYLRGSTIVIQSNLSTNALSIDTSQNVTIPNGTLTVAGNITATASSFVGGAVSVTGTIAGADLSITTGTNAIGGNTTLTGHLYPGADSTYDLGLVTTGRWANLYVDSIGDTGQMVNVATSLKVTNNATFTGIGLEFQYNSGTCYIVGYNRTGAVYLPLIISGSTMTLQIGATNTIEMDASSNVTIPNGNVGINMTPTQKLSLSGVLLVEDYTETNTNNWMLYTDASGVFNFNYNGAGNSEVVFDSSGNVGIGATPTYLLDAQSAGNSYKARFWNGTQGIGLYVASGGDMITSWSAEHISLGVGGNAYLYVNGSGNVGIGTASPEQGLQISKTAYDQLSLTVNGGETYKTYIGHTYSASTFQSIWAVNRRISDGVFDDIASSASSIELIGENGGSRISFYTASVNNTAPSERMRIDGSGNVGIATSTPGVLIGGLDISAYKNLHIQNAGRTYLIMSANSSQYPTIMWENTNGTVGYRAVQNYFSSDVMAWNFMSESTGASVSIPIAMHYNGTSVFHTTAVTIGSTQITTAQDSVINIQGLGGGNSWIGFNNHYDSAFYCGTYTTSAWMIYHVSDDLQFRGDSGLTPGGTYTPTIRFQLLANGDVAANTGNSQIIARYSTGSANYYGSLRWAGLQLGNNGVNRIVAGRSSTGATLAFYTNNTNDAADYTVSPDGNLVLYMNADATAYFTESIGLGNVTPRAWLSAYHAVDWYASSVLGNAANNDAYLVSNAYVDSGSQWRYIMDSGVGIVGVHGDGVRLYTAASGTAGNVASPTEKVFLNLTGYFGLNRTSPDSLLDLEVYANNAYIISLHNAAGTDVGGIYIDSGAAPELYLKDAAGSSINVLLTGDGGDSYLLTGNVGIQTASPGNSSVTGLGFSYSPIFHVHDANAIGLTPTFSSSLLTAMRFVDTGGAVNVKAADILYQDQIFYFRSLTDAGAIKYSSVLQVDTNTNYVLIGGHLQIGTATGADAYIDFEAGTNWALGVDDSDSDAFVLSYSNTPGSTNYLKCDTSANFSTPGKLTLGTLVTSSFTASYHLVVGSGSGASGIVIHTGTSSDSTLYFADSTVTPVGHIQYEHANEVMDFTVGGATGLILDANGHAGLNGYAASSSTSTAADDLAIGTIFHTAAGMTIRNSDIGTGAIYFADATSTYQGGVYYNHSTSSLYLAVTASPLIILSGSGAGSVVIQPTTASATTKLTVESDATSQLVPSEINIDRQEVATNSTAFIGKMQFKSGNTVSATAGVPYVSLIGLYTVKTSGAEEGDFRVYTYSGGVGTFQLEVDGSTGDCNSASGTFGTITSSISKKRDIVYLAKSGRSYWNEFKELEWAKYRYKEDVSRHGDRAQYRLGLTVENVRNIFPSLVVQHIEPNGNLRYSLKTSVIHEIGMFVIQEAQKRIERVENEVLNLRVEHDVFRLSVANRVSKLEDEVEALKKEVQSLKDAA